MVQILVRDMLRRLPNRHLALAAAVFALAWGVFLPKGRASYLAAGSLAFAFYFGPIMMLGWLQPSPVSYLPVSRRDTWRAAWTMSVVAPLVMMTLLKIPGALAASSGWSTLTLSSTMDFLYAGSGCALLAATWGREKEAGRVMLAMISLVAGMFLPFLLRAQLPVQWAAVSPAQAALLGAGAAATVYGALHVPAAGRPLRRALSDGSPVVAPPLASTRLSGLPRLLLHELAFASGLACFMIVVVLGVALAINGWVSVSWRSWLEVQGLLIFSATALDGGPRRWDIIEQIAWCALYVGTVSPRFADAVKHLTVLPIGTARLQLILLGWPILFWSAVWIGLAFLHVLVVGGPATAGYRVPLLLALSGMSGLAISLQLRFAKGPTALISAGPFLIPFTRLGQAPAWVALVVAATTIGLAVALIRNALSRADTYKRASPFGLRTQGAG